MAGRFPPSWLNELRTRSDIVQIISGYVSLKKNGRKYWGLCPFHGEKTASFSVSPEEQLYYCFGCKAGGNVIHFIMDIERLDFYEACTFLADRVHLPLPEMVNDNDYERRKTQRERLLAANLEAAKYYRENLYAPSGAACLSYLKSRGLNDQVIRKFGLGAAPDAWDHVTRMLLDKGYTKEELRLCGLTVVKEAENGRPERTFDMFRNRPIFPIIDQYGNVLGFGGRSLDGKPPKYLNTADTPVFNKRNGVFAANLLRKERNLERVILVEGYMDVVSLTQYGVKGVCATLGTALTNEQARLLKRFAPMVYLGYDGDSAGQHAILRGLDILNEERVPARVLDFPDGLDPDEFIRREGLDGFNRLTSITPESYRLRRLKEQFDLSSSDGRRKYAIAASEILGPLDPVDREAELRELITQSGFDRKTLEEQIGISARKNQENDSEPKRRSPSVRRETNRTDELVRAQEILLSLFATKRVPPELIEPDDFPDEELKLYFTRLHAGETAASIIDGETDEQTRSRLTSLLLGTSVDDTDQILDMAKQCVRQIRRRMLQDTLDNMKKELAVCTDDRKPAILAGIIEISSKLN